MQTSSVLLTCLGFVAGLVLLGLFLTPRPGPTHLAPAQSARPSASAATPGPTLVRLRNFRKGGGNWSGGVTTRDPGQRKVILLWNHAHRISPQSDWFEKNCAVGNCVATQDRHVVDDAAAVVFLFFRWKVSDVPGRASRSPAQLYVAATKEAPSRKWTDTRLDLQLGPNFFNLTMSYRLDSDILAPYMMTVEKGAEEAARAESVEEARRRVRTRRKHRLVAWFVSHCDTQSQREVYVRELQKHIPVDIYGRCGPLTCSNKTQRDSVCLRMLERDYYFYLSFENALCKDYVTEKLGRVLNYYVVPVTLGGTEYSRIAPPHSVINALDFPSPKALAAYLLRLSQNPDEYAHYFDWKPSFDVLTAAVTWANAYCWLCALLHGAAATPPPGPRDLQAWWSGPGVCTHGHFNFT